MRLQQTAGPTRPLLAQWLHQRRQFTAVFNCEGHFLTSRGFDLRILLNQVQDQETELVVADHLWIYGHHSRSQIQALRPVKREVLTFSAMVFQYERKVWQPDTHRFQVTTYDYALKNLQAVQRCTDMPLLQSR